jgi:hypothetical protein
MKPSGAKDIPGTEGNYQIFKEGLVWSRKNNRYLKPQISEPEYPHVTLMISGKQKTARIHRLLAEAFLPNPKNFPQVNHKDGNKRNFALSNLEWCDNTYNALHAYQTGLNRTLYSFRGVHAYSAKLNPIKVRKIRKLIKMGQVSLRAIGRMFGVSVNNIIQIRDREIWKEV